MKNIKNLVALIVALTALEHTAFGANIINPIEPDVFSELPMTIRKQFLESTWITDNDLNHLDRAYHMNPSYGLKNALIFWKFCKTYTYNKGLNGAFLALLTDTKLKLLDNNLLHLTVKTANESLTDEEFYILQELINLLNDESSEGKNSSRLETITIKNIHNKKILSLQRKSVKGPDGREKKEFVGLNCSYEISVPHIVELIKMCTMLEDLDLTNCDNAGAGITEVLRENSEALKNLKKIDLSGSNTNITAAQLAKLFIHCQNLVHLDLSACKNAGAGITSALNNPANQALKNLKLINLSFTQITAEQLAKLFIHCQNLEELELRWCENAGAGITSVLNNPANQALKNLKSINLSFTQITAEQLVKLIIHCKNLEYLELICCPSAGAGITEALMQNSEALKSLKTIDLDFTRITAEQLVKLIIHCKNLEHLGLRDCENAGAGITEALKQNSEALKSLKTINLSNTQITAEQLAKLIIYCKNLEHLDLRDCENAGAGITEALKQNSEALKSLKTINLSNTYITATQLTELIIGCKNLEDLNLTSCKNAGAGITTALMKNSEALKSLKQIDLYNSNVTDEVCELLRDRCPQLIIY